MATARQLASLAGQTSAYGPHMLPLELNVTNPKLFGNLRSLKRVRPAAPPSLP